MEEAPTSPWDPSSLVRIWGILLFAKRNHPAVRFSNISTAAYLIPVIKI